MMDVIDTINMISYYAHGSLNLIGLYINRFAILDLVISMRNNFWTLDTVQNVKSKNGYIQRLRLLKIKYKIYIRFLLTDLGIFLYGETLLQGKLDEDTWPVKLYIPSYLNMYFVYLFDSIIAYVMMLCAIIQDVLMFSIVALTEMQFDILNEEFTRMFTRSHTCKENDDENVKFRKCNNHLTYLLRFRDLMNDTFSLLLLLYFGLIILSLCTNMYAVSTSDSSIEVQRAFGHGLGLFLQFMISYCNPVQRLVDAAEKTAEKVYMSEWYQHPKYYKDVNMLIGKAQQKFYVTAGSLIHVDHLSGLATLKTVISYWGFLRTVGASE